MNDKKMKIKKIKIPKNTILYLLLIAVFTFVIRINLDSRAKYFTGENKTVSARAAKFSYNVKKDIDSIEIDLNKENTKSFEFEIRNDNIEGVSEVGIKYGIIMTFSEKIMELLENNTLVIKEIYINDEIKSITPEISKSNKTYTYKELGNFDASVAKVDKCKIVFEVSDDVEEIELEGIGLKVSFDQLI